MQRACLHVCACTGMQADMGEPHHPARAGGLSAHTPACCFIGSTRGCDQEELTVVLTGMCLRSNDTAFSVLLARDYVQLAHVPTTHSTIQWYGLSPYLLPTVSCVARPSAS